MRHDACPAHQCLPSPPCLSVPLSAIYLSPLPLSVPPHLRPPLVWCLVLILIPIADLSVYPFFVQIITNGAAFAIYLVLSWFAQGLAL